MKKQVKAEYLPRNDDIEVLFPEEEQEELTAAEKAAGAAIEQLSSNAEKGKVIRIYRQLGSGRESMEFVAKYPADKYTIDDLIDKLKYEYGGGDYRFMIYNEKGKLVANKLICIAKKSTLKPEGGVNNGLYGVLERMMDKQDEFMRRMLGNNNGEKSRLEFMQEMMVMKELFSPNGTSGSPMGQVKETLELMTMLREEANPEKESGGFGEIMKGALPLLTSIAQNAQGKPQQPPQPNPTERPRRTRKKQDDNHMQKLAINKLLDLKHHNMTAADAAEKINAEIPDAYVPQIESLIMGDDAVDRVIAINSEAERHKIWLTDVFEYLKGYFGHKCKFDSEFDENIDNSEKTADNSANESNNINNDGNT